jgi:hypothetical protein
VPQSAQNRLLCASPAGQCARRGLDELRSFRAGSATAGRRRRECRCSSTSSAERLVLSCVVLRERSDRGPRQLQQPSWAAARLPCLAMTAASSQCEASYTQSIFYASTPSGRGGPPPRASCTGATALPLEGREPGPGPAAPGAAARNHSSTRMPELLRRSKGRHLRDSLRALAARGAGPLIRRDALPAQPARRLPAARPPGRQAPTGQFQVAPMRFRSTT